MSLPKVSCICPTFARYHLLNESVESFLRQDYSGESELIVLNDFAPQTLHFTHPKVKVVNVENRFPTLGEKRDAAYRLATGDVFITWGDDDIHLPHRVSRMVSFLGEDPMAFEGWFYVIHENGIYLERRSTAGAHVITSEAYATLGGIPALDKGEDVAFNDLAQKHFSSIRACKNPPAFIYRWHGTNRLHVSGTGSKDPYKAVYDRAIELVSAGKEPQGSLQIKPEWVDNYSEIVKGAKLR